VAGSIAQQADRQKNLLNLLWAMHNSDEADREAAAVTCYLDESGTHDDAR